MRSTLTFWARLNNEPSEEADLLKMAVTRAIVAQVTGHEVPGGLRTSPSTREICYCVHADCIPQEWLSQAEHLIQQGYISRYEWSGEIEQKKENSASLTVELIHDGRTYKGVLYQCAQEE